MKVSVPEKWTEFGTRPFKYALQKIKADTNERGWWTYVPIHKKDNVLIGSCGYKGKPDADGAVEIGYEIIKPYRNQGLGMELAKALVMNAFAAPSVKAIKAYTLANDNASTRILTKNGFLKKGEIDDVANEKLWRWELKK
ncbi:N-acetyltransferase [Runella aurantiaca]|uniref:N-acetyltransferase n=1 Tax=Runella aurantiaca TaxID=2282308 RepID=A0A369I779_9BACT|nr:N-acetyltransferase [Runella aurantiaca]